MSIEKLTKTILQHDPSPYTTMFNEVLQGIRNTNALGVYCYLASKPPGWEIVKKELQLHFNCGREKIDSAFAYLKEVGAIEITSIRDDLGKIVSWTTLLKRHIIIQPTIRVSQNVVKPDCGKPAPIKERSIEIKERYKEKEASQDFLALEPYIDVWNEIAVKEGCPPMGTDKRQLLAIKRNLKEVNKVWENELSPITFKIWLNNAVITKAFLICKYKSRMEVCVRPHHFLDIYNQVKEEQKA